VWTFFDFVSQNGTNQIIDWYRRDLSEDAQFLFDKVLKDCQKIELPQNWPAFRKRLKGRPKEDRIWELEFYSDGRQYRILGVFGPLRKQATLLIGCYHKMRIYTPSDAIETAIRRARLLANGEASHHERKIAIDR
jgi:hypothetical protein